MAMRIGGVRSTPTPSQTGRADLPHPAFRSAAADGQHNHPSRPTSENRRSRPHHHGKSQSHLTPDLGVFSVAPDNSEQAERFFITLENRSFFHFSTRH